MEIPWGVLLGVKEARLGGRRRDHWIQWVFWGWECPTESS